MLHRQLQILSTTEIPRRSDALVIARDVGAEIIIRREVAGCGVESWLAGGGQTVAGGGGRCVGDAESVVGEGANGVRDVVCDFVG